MKETDREYKTTKKHRFNACKSWGDVRRMRGERNRKMAELAENAKVICDTPELCGRIKMELRERINARRRAISAGDITISEKSISEVRSEAARKERILTPVRLESLKKARSMTRNFQKGVKSYDYSDNPYDIGNVKSTIEIPKTNSALERLAEKILADEEMLAFVRRELARRAKEANRGLSKEQIKGKKRRAISGHPRAYTVTQKVKARNAKNAKLLPEYAKKYFEHGGERHCIREWAKIRGLSYSTLRYRLRLYAPEVALDPNFNALHKAGMLRGKRKAMVKMQGQEKK